MNRQSLVRSLVAALVVVPLVACASVTKHFTKKKEGLQQVDVLLSEVERVHVESVLSKEHAQSALGHLQALTAQDFEGDAVAAFDRLCVAIGDSEVQAEKLRDSVGPMRKASEAFFDQWVADLEGFTSPEMRRRSQIRMADTRARYDAIVVAVEPAQATYDAFNRTLKDYSLFLGNDFNADAVSDLSTDVDALAQREVELQAALDACVAAAEEYVGTTALRGQLDKPAASTQKPRSGSASAATPSGSR